MAYQRTLRTLAVDELTPYPGNPRRGDVAAIAESLRANGQFAPIVVREGDLVILAGNHTWEAARSLAWEHIDAYVLAGVDEQASRKIVAAANRTADLGTYDNGDLIALLQSIDDLDGTGYSDDNLATFLAKLDEGQFEPGDAADDPRLDRKSMTKCPHCGTEFEPTTYNVAAGA